MIPKVENQMISDVNHIAIAVPDLEKAANGYRAIFGAKVSDIVDLPDHGVSTVFVDLDNTKIELLHPLGENSPIQKFLDKNPDGGLHHICYEVDDILEAKAAIEAGGIRILGDGEPKIGAHGKPVLFLHPKDCAGTLLEIEEK